MKSVETILVADIEIDIWEVRELFDNIRVHFGNSNVQGGVADVVLDVRIQCQAVLG